MVNNVAVIWLKGEYLDKMPTYTRPGKIICILKESSVQLMNTVSRSAMVPHEIWSPFKACPIRYNDYMTPTNTFYIVPSLIV